MCLAIPGKVIRISADIPDLKMARVDFDGVVKNICIEWVNVEEGDYVLAHAGVALCRVDEEEAERTIVNFRRLLMNMEVEENYPLIIENND